MSDEQPLMEWGFAGRALGEAPGREHSNISGDVYVVAPFEKGTLVAVIDGLGHGIEAAIAARAAAQILEAHAGEPVLELVKQCHEGLRKTRGAVMSLASFRAEDSSVIWTGIGNVEGILLRANPLAEPRRESILVRGGVVGFQIPSLRAAKLPVWRGDTLILATDGIQSRFTLNLSLEQDPQQTADTIFSQHYRGSDDALVLVARYLGL